MTTLSTRQRILVVDDEPDVCELLTYQLRGEGREFTICTRGIDATIALLESLRDMDPFQVAILDCSLPYYDGFTIAQVLRLSEKTGISSYTVKIGIYTAYSKTVENSTLVQTSGVDAYWIKGSGEEEMIRQVNEWLKQNDCN